MLTTLLNSSSAPVVYALLLKSPDTQNGFLQSLVFHQIYYFRLCCSGDIVEEKLCSNRHFAKVFLFFLKIDWAIK